MRYKRRNNLILIVTIFILGTNFLPENYELLQKIIMIMFSLILILIAITSLDDLKKGGEGK